MTKKQLSFRAERIALLLGWVALIVDWAAAFTPGRLSVQKIALDIFADIAFMVVGVIILVITSRSILHFRRVANDARIRLLVLDQMAEILMNPEERKEYVAKRNLARLFSAKTGKKE